MGGVELLRNVNFLRRQFRSGLREYDGQNPIVHGGLDFLILIRLSAFISEVDM